MLIFDSFPDLYAAEQFASRIRQRFQVETYVCKSHEESNAIDPFPYQLTPPIVLVERTETDDHVILLVKQFKGEFAGT